MRGAACDDFQDTRILKICKGPQQVALVVVVENPQRFLEAALVHARRLVKLRLVLTRAMHFLLGQFKQPLEVAQIAALEQFIGQHRGQRRGDGHGQAKRDTLACQPFHHCDQRDVRFGDRLVQPMLLEHVFMLGMPHEGQMRVQDQTQITGWIFLRHAPFPPPAAYTARQCSKFRVFPSIMQAETHPGRIVLDSSASRAKDLGSRALSLFGLSPASPLRYDSQGCACILLPNGGSVTRNLG
jgi:hypothetical protein